MPIEKHHHKKLYEEVNFHLSAGVKLVHEFHDPHEYWQFVSVVIAVNEGFLILQSRLHYTKFVHEEEDYESDVQVFRLPRQFGVELITLIITQMNTSLKEMEFRLSEPEPEDFAQNDFLG